MNTSSNCIICSSPLSGKQTRFCSSSCKNKFHQSYDSQKKRALERKLFLVKALGGKCANCGYNRNLSALSFHHNQGKEFKLDARSLSNRKIDTTVRELSKCTLLCNNCHAEAHNPKLSLANLSIEPTALTTELQARFPNPLKTKDIVTKNDLIFNKTKADQIRIKFLTNLSNKVSEQDTLVLGVSGGVDSVVMLDLFVKNFKTNYIVAHLNHGTRKESDDDEKFVENLAKKHGIEFVSKKITPPDFGNLEEELRLERHRYLEEVRLKNKGKYIALAHNANDQAETFFLNALRGSGPAGLAAIKESDRIIRPLLNISREEIEGYAKKNNLKWHEDITNVDTNYARNCLRKVVLPHFSKINPQWLENLNRTSMLQKNIDEYLKKEASKYLNASASDLRKLDKPVLYEVFGLLYEKTRGDRIDLTLTHLSALDDLISEAKGTKAVDLPHDIKAVRSYESLDFTHKIRYNSKSLPDKTKLKIGSNAFGGWMFAVIKQSVEESDMQSLSIPNSLLAQIFVRTRKDGDRIKTAGGEKKLQDLFVNAKIKRENRERWPVICTKSKILWVPGLAFAKDLPKENLDINICARMIDEE